jgi:predicted DNA-binding protein YlxM (UPF0122 family)
MGKPEAVFDERTITKAELEKLHRHLDYYDRQDSIERIYDLTDKYSDKNYSELIYIIEEIRNFCEEFI